MLLAIASATLLGAVLTPGPFWMNALLAIASLGSFVAFYREIQEKPKPKTFERNYGPHDWKPAYGGADIFDMPVIRIRADEHGCKQPFDVDYFSFDGS